MKSSPSSYFFRSTIDLSVFINITFKSDITNGFRSESTLKISLELAYFSLELSIASIDKRSVVVSATISNAKCNTKQVKSSSNEAART